MIRRRNFIRGLLGAAVALPFLESVHRDAEGQTGADPKRFVYLHQVNGTEYDRFFPDPSAYGTLTPSSFGTCALSGLAAYADKLIIPRGICTAPNPLWGAGHFHGQSKRLTAAPLARYELEDVGNDPTQYAGGISIDQLIARELNPGGRSPLNLHVGPVRDSAQGVISYRGSDDPVFGESNPAVAYAQVLGLAAASEEARAQIISRRQSVLDLVRGEMQALERLPLSRSDQNKLDLHFTTIRELESDLVDTGLMFRLPPEDEARLDGIDSSSLRASRSVQDLTDLHIRVLTVAIATGYTRAATLEVGPSAGNIVYDWLGLDYGHHKVSHGSTTDGSDGPELPGWENMMHEVDKWHAQRFLQLIEALDAYEEDGGTVLDNSVVVWSNEMSRGRAHSTRDVPFIMAGSCGGYLRTGQYTKLVDDTHETVVSSTRQNRPIYSTIEQYRAGDYRHRSGLDGLSNDAPHNKLLTTILNAVGVTADDGGPVEMFGEGLGTLPGELEELKA